MWFLFRETLEETIGARPTNDLVDFLFSDFVAAFCAPFPVKRRVATSASKIVAIWEEIPILSTWSDPKFLFYLEKKDIFVCTCVSQTLYCFSFLRLLLFYFPPFLCLWKLENVWKREKILLLFKKGKDIFVCTCASHMPWFVRSPFFLSAFHFPLSMPSERQAIGV